MFLSFLQLFLSSFLIFFSPNKVKHKNGLLYFPDEGQELLPLTENLEQLFENYIL